MTNKPKPEATPQREGTPRRFRCSLAARIRMSERKKIAWTKPAHRNKVAATKRATWAKPETVARASEAMRLAWIRRRRRIEDEKRMAISLSNALNATSSKLSGSAILNLGASSPGLSNTFILESAKRLWTNLSSSVQR
jgi:hypothetical protein